MKSIHFISNYFIAPENRDIPNVKLEDGSGIKLSWGRSKSYENMSRYTNWLSSMIKYSIEVDIEVVKLAKLMKKGVIEKLGWSDDDVFLSIFLDSLDRTDDGLGIEENILSYNSKILDE